MKKITLLLTVLTIFAFSWLGSAQSTINITTSGGSYTDEKWVSVTTAVDGGGTQVWGQGNGTYGNGQGLINQDISIAPGTYYVNCYDRFSDGWDGTLISVTAYGSVIGDNGGASPSDSGTNDSTSLWETPADELEASFEIIVPSPPACLTPSAMAASNHTTTGADLDWTAGDTETVWDLEIGLTGFTATGTPTNNDVTKPFTYSAGTSGTTYDVYYRADCNADNIDVSTWIGPFSFTTDQPGNTCNNPIVVAALPYNTSDDTANYLDDYSGSPGSSNCGTTSNYLNGDDVVYAYTATSDTLLNFALSGLGNTYSGMFVYTDCADIGTSCAVGHANGSSSADYNFELGVTNGTTYYVVISTWPSPQSTTFTLDITEISCPDPGNTDAINITDTGADIEWADLYNSNWDIFIAASGGSAPTSGTTPTVDDVTSHPYTWTGGSATTAYEVWVRADCGADNTSDLSAWIGPASFTTVSADAPDWYNLQHPASITMTVGDTGTSLDVYAQVYEPGVTDAAGQGAGIDAWIGYGPTGTNPNTWTNWIVATYNTDVGNNDEYTINFGSPNTPAPGTYDYASRFQLNGGLFSYGGLSGGPWDGTTNVSGVLTVNPVDGDLCTNAISLTLGTVFTDNSVVVSNANTTASGELPAPSCSYFGSGEDNWYSIVVPASGNVTIETKTDDGSITDIGMQVYSGACGTLVAVECDDDDGDDYFSLVDLTGQTPATILYIRVFEYGNNATGTFLLSAYTKCSGATTTYDNIIADWDNGAPTEHTPAVIGVGADIQMIDEDLENFTACTCTINTGVTVTVNDGYYIKVINEFVNNGTIKVESKGSFVQVNDDATVTGTAANFEVEIETLPIDATDKYNYVSSPTNGETLDVFDWVMTNRIWEFDATAQDWTLAATTDVMTPGKGYIVRPDPGQTFPYTGKTYFNGAFNNGEVKRNLTYNAGGTDDDNTLVGNPYPSSINTANLLTANPRANAFYFWAHETDANSGSDDFVGIDDYAVYNSSGYASGNATVDAPAKIASGQGFFVVSNAGTDPLEITFNNALRETTGNTILLRPNNNLDKIWINLTTDVNINSQILVAFNPICTDGFDAQYDATRFNSGASVSLASMGVGVGTDNLAIQTRGLLSDTDTVIPLRLDLTDSNITNYTFSIDHFDNLTNENVYLRDNELNVLHNLKLSDYNFTPSTIGVDVTRFELVFSRTALSIKDDVVSSNDLIISNLDETHIKVSMNDGSTITNFKAYDVLGKSIIDIQPNQHSFDISTRINQGTVIFIKATLENGQVLSKKFIKL